MGLISSIRPTPEHWAQSFNGTDTYFENDSFDHITDYPVSIGAWCRGGSSGTRIFFSLTDHSTTVDYIAAQRQHGTRAVNGIRRATGDSNQNSVGTVSFLTEPGWHLVVMVCASATSGILYVDDVDAVENTNSVGWPGITKLSIARFGSSSPGQYISGDVDNLFVSDEALSATDIANIFNSGAGHSFPSLAGNEPVTHGKFTNAYDLSQPGGLAIDLIGGKHLTRGGSPTRVVGHT